MSSNRVVAAVSAAVFGAAGLWGLIAAAVSGSDVLLAGQVGTNLATALGHLVLTAMLVIGWVRGDGATRRWNTAVGSVLLLVGIFGLFAIGTDANVLGLSGASNVLHFAASTALLSAGLGASRGEPGP